MAQVSLRKIVKMYEGDVQAVKGIDLEIADHEFVVLVGPPAAASPPRCA
jgi:multiple sugar transport system ATP-binding protein